MLLSRIFSDIRTYRHELFFSLLLTIPALNYYVNSVIQLQFGMKSISPIVYIILALVGLSAYLNFGKTNSRAVKIIAVLLLIDGVIACMMWDISPTLIGNLKNPLESPVLMLFLYCIPALILGSIVTEWSKVALFLTPICVLTILLLLPSYNAEMNGNGMVEYMTISYNALFASCFCFAFGMRNKRLLLTILGALGMLFIITIGARGAAVCSVAFLLLYLIKFLRTKDSGNKLSLIYVIIIIVAAFVYVVPRVSEMITSGDVHSRVFSMMEEGDLFTSHSRRQIREGMMAGIFHNPFGYGIWGDKVILAKTYGQQANVYSHNILLDFLAYFGVILGPILFFCLLRMIYKKIVPFRFSLLSDLLIALLPYGFLMLFFSGTMSDHIAFYAMLGLLLNKQQSDLDFANL